MAFAMARVNLFGSGAAARTAALRRAVVVNFCARRRGWRRAAGSRGGERTDVEALLTTLLSSTTGLVAYLAVFGILVACGLGIPMPEDISLIIGGYLAHLGAV